MYQRTAQAQTAKLIALDLWESKQAGTKADPPTQPIADMTCDGRDTVPVLPVNEVVIEYVGRMTPPSLKQLEDFPELKDEPAIELAPTKAQRNGARIAALCLVSPDFMGFGPNRVTATVEQPAKDLTLLHNPSPLSAGHYVLFCGARSYEVVVE